MFSTIGHAKDGSPRREELGKTLENLVGAKIGNRADVSAEIYLCICMRQCVSWMKTKFESQNHIYVSHLG